MAYILYALAIFWMIFLATPREGIVAALILFAVVVVKLLRLEIKAN